MDPSTLALRICAILCGDLATTAPQGRVALPDDSAEKVVEHIHRGQSLRLQCGTRQSFAPSLAAGVEG